MQTFTEMPYGYRWMTSDEIEEYNMLEPDEQRWGWHRDEHVGVIDGTYIVKWDCMIEFEMDHDHDPEECERILADMSYDGWDQSPAGYREDPEYWTYMNGSSHIGFAVDY